MTFSELRAGRQGLAATLLEKGDGQGDRVALSLLRSATSEGDLHAFVAQRLAPFKVARYIEMVAVLPLTWSKKIAKAQLKASRSDRILGSGDALHGARIQAPSLHSEPDSARDIGS